MKKVLVIRFGGIGDVVLASIAFRSICEAYPGCAVHVLTKAAFVPLVEHDPHVAKVHGFDGDFWGMLRELRRERFVFVFDLHNSLRSGLVRWGLGVRWGVVRKRSLAKRWMAGLGRGGGMELGHVVGRYGEVLARGGVELAEGGLGVWVPREVVGEARGVLEGAGIGLGGNGVEVGGDEGIGGVDGMDGIEGVGVLGVVLGGTYATKKWLPKYYVELLDRWGWDVVLIGGRDCEEDARYIEEGVSVGCFNAVGRYGLLMSAALLGFCDRVVAHDTGFMHVAAGLGKPIVSLWGNTVPGFGMWPYGVRHVVAEVEGLGCRPCSRLGYDDCPQGHFRCMRDLRVEVVLEGLRSLG